MRLSAAATALVVLAPAVTMAQSAGTTDTTTITSYAATVTMTLLQVNATSTHHHTSKMPTSLTTSGGSYNTPTLSSISTASMYSASATQCDNCMMNGASNSQTNFALAAVAGGAALFWSSL